VRSGRLAGMVRGTLQAVCCRTIPIARKHRCGIIVLEMALDKLRSGQQELFPLQALK